MGKPETGERAGSSGYLLCGAGRDCPPPGEEGRDGAAEGGEDGLEGALTEGRGGAGLETFGAWPGLLIPELPGRGPLGLTTWGVDGRLGLLVSGLPGRFPSGLPSPGRLWPG